MDIFKSSATSHETTAHRQIYQTMETKNAANMAMSCVYLQLFSRRGNSASGDIYPHHSDLTALSAQIVNCQ